MATNQNKKKRRRKLSIHCDICFEHKLAIQHHQGCSQCTFRICWDCMWQYFKCKNEPGDVQVNVKEKLFRVPCPGCRQTSLFLDCMHSNCLLHMPAANVMAEILINYVHEDYCDHVLCINATKCFSKRTRKKFKKSFRMLTAFFFEHIATLKIGMADGDAKCLSDDCIDEFCPQWSRLLDVTAVRVTNFGQAYELFRLIWCFAAANEREKEKIRTLHLATLNCSRFCEKATQGCPYDHCNGFPGNIPYLVTLSHNAYGYETIRQHSASLTKADLDCFATTNLDMHYLHLQIKWHVKASKESSILTEERKKSREGFYRHNTVQRQQLHEDLMYHFFT